MCLVFINTLYCLILSMLIGCVWLFATPWTAAHQVSLSFTISWILPKFISIKLVMLSNHFSFCLLSFPTSGSFPMSRHFTSEYWPKYWNFSFNISPSSEYSGLMLGRIEAWRRRGWQRIRWVDVKADSMDMSLCELPETVKDREAWQAAVHEGANSCTWLND